MMIPLLRRNTMKVFATILTLFFSMSALFAQSQTISGKILDSRTNDPIVGATVKIKGTSNGTSSDAQGNFTISTSSPAILQVNFIGYNTFEARADFGKSMTIKLVATDKELEDVVVVGYGTKKREVVAGAISQVGKEVFKDRPVPNAALALQGAVPGLQVTRTSARPGNEDLRIRLRGESSVAAVDPLIIVDGIPMIGTFEISQINPYDIENVTTLKDASAAIYGARAQGGVILITTKRGRNSKPQINYNSTFSRNIQGLQVPWATAAEWASLYLQVSTADRRDANGNPTEWFPQWNKEILTRLAAGESFDFTETNGVVRHYEDNNWQDALYGPSNSTMQNLSVNGGSEKSTYNLSMGYSNNKSMLQTAYDGEKKLNLRLNYDFKFSEKVKLSTQIGYDNRKVESPRNGIGNGYFDAPIFPTYNRLGQYYDDYGYRNPVAATTSGGTVTNNEGIFRVNGNLSAQLLKELKITGTAAVVNRNGWNKAYNQTYNLYSYNGDRINSVQFAPPNNPAITETVGNTVYQNYGVQLDFNKTLATNHNISAMLANTAELQRAKTISATRSQLLFDGLYDINTAISPSTIAYNNSNSGGSNQFGLLSYIARFNYDYKKKYILELLGRRDGSSRFDVGYKWSNFYGAFLGWRLTQENFLKDVKWLNELKPRFSYGETGGQANIGFYDYLATVNVTGTALFGSTPAMQGTATQLGITTNQRTWERMANTNIGIDFAMFNNKLSGALEVYERRNIGMLIGLTYPATLGGGAPTTNSGTFWTRGWEASVAWRSTLADGKLTYNIGLNIWNDKSKVTSFAGRDTWTAGKNSVRQGYPLNSLFVYKTDGVFQTQEEVTAYMAKYGASGDAAGYTGVSNTFRPGDLKRVDLDGDGRITATGTGQPGSGDTYYYGDANPHYNFGINLGAQYKGFDFSAFIQGVGKWNILRTGNARAPFFRNYVNANTAYIGQTWTPQNTTAPYPRLSFDSSINNWNWTVSDVNIQNLRYARLKSLIVGYTLPAQWSKKVSMQKARLFFSGNDLFEITSLKDGFDPERGESADNSYPFFRTLSFGIDLTF